MTVKNLIERLSQWPGETEVRFATSMIGDYVVASVYDSPIEDGLIWIDLEQREDE